MLRRIVGGIAGGAFAVFSLMANTVTILSTTPEVIRINLPVWGAFLNEYWPGGGVTSQDVARWLFLIFGLLIIGATNLPSRFYAAVIRPFTGRGGPAVSPSQPAGPSLPSFRARYVQHDGVLWMDAGHRYVQGGILAEGPLCPADRATLRFLPRPRGGPEPPGSEDLNSHWDDVIGEGRGRLLCPECRVTYLLVADGQKKLSTSRYEAEARLEGEWRRENT